MKKLISFISAFAIIAGVATAFANIPDTIEGYYKDDKLVIENLDNVGIAVINGYIDGRLSGSDVSEVVDGVFECDADFLKDAQRLRLAYGGQVCNVKIIEPVATPTPKPTRTPRPAVYEKALDAVHAPAVVRGVESAFVNGENCYSISMLYQGNEVTVNVGEDIQIVSAPAKDAYMTGKTAETLNEGDVIHFLCNLQGQVTSIDLIYRPDFADYITDNTDFTTLYGNDGYSQYKMGVVVRTGKASVLVSDLTGTTTDYEVDKGAFIYSVADRRTDKTELYGLGAKAVITSGMHPDNLDDNDCIISMSAISEPVYALIRQVRGVATEIIVLDYMY